MITANSFMKREFGRKLIEEFLPRVDLTHVIDTSGAYIPGHGTPTVILFGRDRPPIGETVRTVMGITGEPSTPADPGQGQVWRAIVDQLDMVGSESEFVSVADAPRSTLSLHPWSLGGGGASEVKSRIESGRVGLRAIGGAPAIGAVTLEDDAFVAAESSLRRAGLPETDRREFVEGDELRDWSCSGRLVAIFPYRPDATVAIGEQTARYLWPMRTRLWNRTWFGKTQSQRELSWYEYGFLAKHAGKSTLSIAYGEVATHNHFVLDRRGKVFKQTAPVIKLPAGASEEDYLGLLGLLNSSVACFWLKQVCHNKGSTVDERGARQRTAPFEDFYAFNSTKVAAFPVANSAPVDLGRAIDALAQQRVSDDLVAAIGTAVFNRSGLDSARERAKSVRARMITLQEELDWRCYRLYGLADEPLEHPNPPGLALGERAFEIVLARRMASGDEQSTWFERHGSTPITELPAHWPDDFRAVVERRIALIESDRNIGLIERPEYKRRWNDEPWEAQERRALSNWLLDRLESGRYWPRTGDVPLRSTSRLADLARTDDDFMQVAALYAGDEAVDVAKLVAELVESESVPFLPALRYTDDGLRKRAEWERTWDLQRQEDATGERLDVPVPPKYKSSDFKAGHFWRLRGSLDVPKERFVSYPGASLDADGSLVVTWAGYDHLQQARALAGHILDLKENHGWGKERLIPLLAGLAELLPWLKQWYNEPDPTMGERMGDYFEGFVQDEARAMGVTVVEVQAWRPQAAARGRRRRS